MNEDDFKRLLDANAERVEKRFDDAVEEMRRHFDSTAERMEKRFDLLAETVAHVDGKVDRES